MSKLDNDIATQKLVLHVLQHLTLRSVMQKDSSDD